MTPERWRQVRAIFDAVVERDPAARPEFLREQCGADEDLRREVEALLASDESAGALLDQPLLGLGTVPGLAGPGTALRLRTIGLFELKEELGRGAMGVVFRGFDPVIGRPVAIKVIRPDPLTSPKEKSELQMRFAREAAAAGQLSHPNIVTVYQFGEERDLQYLVLELIDGVSLEKILADRQPQNPKTAAPILAQVADALDYAHREGVVHRDVKPANILLRPDGKIKLTDFGIARMASHTVTRTGHTFGTPAYMSPEQMRTAHVDGRADQFSLGVIAYEMLCGRRPFAGPGLELQILENEPPPVHTVNPAVPPRSSEVIAKALAKKPEDRFPSCREFVERLQDSLQATPVETGHEPQPEAASTATSTMATIRTTGEGAAPEVQPPPVAKEEPPAPPPRRRLGLRVAAGLAVVGLAVSVAAVLWWNRPPGPPSTDLNKASRGEYVWIPPGTFQMGCSPGDGECYDNEKPAHQVIISRGFWMGRTEVTQEAWQKVMGSNPSGFEGPHLPVENVTWDEARRYCEAAGKRLPTEAEWEYAARAGSAASRYGDLEKIAWYDGNSGNQTHEVGGKRANPWGLRDMLGNVAEWVADWLEDPYPSGSTTDPQGPGSGEFRVVRGGSWFPAAGSMRVSRRYFSDPDERHNWIGVRCAGN